MKLKGRLRMIVLAGCCAIAGWVDAAGPTRRVISLNGTWQVEQEMDASSTPVSFSRTGPVPGLVDMVRPSRFADPATGFWYRTVFQVGQKIPAVARIQLADSTGISELWLNGVPVKRAPHGGFDVETLLKAAGDNELLIRSVPAAQTGAVGIFGDVDLVLAGKEFIEEVQIEPNATTGEVKVKVRFRAGAEVGKFTYRVHTNMRARTATFGSSDQPEFSFTMTDYQLRTETYLFNYVLELTTPSDRVCTRFAMQHAPTVHRGEP